MLFALLTLVTASPALAQEPVAAAARSSDGLWQPASDSSLPTAQRRSDLQGTYSVVQLNRGALDALLAQAPDERLANRAAAGVVITLPLPDGRFSRFQIEESPILEPGLVAAFPAIKTYRGAGLDDPTATARFDVTLNGFHAMVIAAEGTVYVDPYATGDLVNHVAYDKATLRPRDLPFFDQVVGAREAQERLYNTFPITNGTSLRTYRLALAATVEYTAAAGSVPNALSRMTTTMNRVNGIYERELAVRMTVLTGPTAGSTALIFSAEPDGYTNNSGSAMLSENQAKLDTVIGTANYDIGHVFSTGGGGIASLGSVCSVGSKGRGVTGSFNPVGDAFDVDYVAHEMGHQFGGNHTFNGTTGNCGGGNRSNSHAYEVGSGSTIQAYAGICGLEDLQPHSDPIFNFESLNEMTAFITSGGGFSCGTATATGNSVPVVSGPGASFTIPRLTPFALTATGSDANGDSVTYLWEEHDLGTSSTSATVGTDDGSRPLFRSYSPSTTPTRMFPSLTYILNNANTPPLNYTCVGGGTCTTGEVLPSTSRTMTFMVTARDNRAGGGGINTAQTQVVVNAALGPFAVTAPNTAVSWTGTTSQTVTWSETGTSAIAATVRILLSTDGGATFPTVLLNGTPNDGTETVTVPNTPTTTARIKVEAVGNIFFDVSNANFTIVAGGPPPGAFGKSAPANAATGQVLSPTISWGASTNATSYEYCVDTTANSSCDAGWVSVGSATSAVLSGLNPSRTYSWQARAVNPVGTTVADTGTWWTFTTQALTAPIADLAVDFGPGTGLWALYDGGTAPTWQPLHGLSPTRLTRGDLDGNGRADLVMTFAGLGTWAYMNNASWTQLHPFDAGLIETGDVDGNGRDDVVVTFSGFGSWIRYDSGGWMQLNSLTPTVIAVGNIDGSAGGKADIVLSFGSAGIWVYSNNASWFNLHNLSALDLKIGDLDGNGTGDLIVQFSCLGEYILYNSTTWALLHPLAASGIALGNLDGDAGGRTDVVINFPGLGVYTFVNGTTWSLMHGLNASKLATGDIDGNGSADVILNFPGLGIWTFRNGTTWTQIHNLDPDTFVAGRMNAN